MHTPHNIQNNPNRLHICSGILETQRVWVHQLPLQYCRERPPHGSGNNLIFVQCYFLDIGKQQKTVLFLVVQPLKGGGGVEGRIKREKYFFFCFKLCRSLKRYLYASYFKKYSKQGHKQLDRQNECERTVVKSKANCTLTSIRDRALEESVGGGKGLMIKEYVMKHENCFTKNFAYIFMVVKA